MAKLKKRPVFIDHIRLRKFKKVNEIKIDMDTLNILVGGNNSGKSSVLQGIHFSVIASIASRQLGRDTFTQSNLLYCPARDFMALRNGQAYMNQSNFGYLNISARALYANQYVKSNFQIKIYRGRNEGNVGCQRSGDIFLGRLISDDKNLFSIYVPGLAGIPQDEQFRSESVVRRGVAGGDANMDFPRNSGRSNKSVNYF